MTTKHMWVELRYTPLIVTEEENGSLTVEVEETAEKVAEEEALHGCWFCMAPLTAEAFPTECPGSIFEGP